MATINKKPTKAHKSKKVVKAHQGMAHIPRQRPIGGPSPKRRPTDPQAIPKFARESVGRARDLLKGKTRGPIAPRPQAPTIQQPKPVRQPSVIKPMIKPVRPTPIQSDAGGGRGQIGQIGPRKLTSREKRRRDNFFKSEADEMLRQANKNRRPRRPRPLGGVQTPNLLGAIGGTRSIPAFLSGDQVGYPQQSTALTDRFTKQQQELVQAQNKNNLNQNRLQMQRNKGGDVKKYAVGGLNKGMTKSRTKYGTVDNKKK